MDTDFASHVVYMMSEMERNVNTDVVCFAGFVSESTLADSFSSATHAQ
jgi:hypothetical protein